MWRLWLRGASPAGTASEEGGGRDEGPVQGRKLRLQRERHPGAVYGQLACGACGPHVPGVRFLGVQMRSSRVARNEHRFARESLQDVRAERFVEAQVAKRRGSRELPVRKQRR